MWLKTLTVCFLIIVSPLASIRISRNRNFEWRNWPPLPADAYEVAPFLYIGKVRTERGSLVATIDSITNVATAVLNTMRQYRTDTSILSTNFSEKFYWERVNFSLTPGGRRLMNAVRGGFQEDIQIVLYIGKINHHGRTKIGKVIPPNKPYAGLWVWDEAGMPLRFYEFELLKIRQ